MATALQTQLSFLTYQWSDFEDDQRRNQYRHRLVEAVRLEQSLPVILSGTQGKRQATVRVVNVATQGIAGGVGGQTPGNTDLTLADLQMTGDGLQGQSASVQLYDLDTNTAYLPLTGTISDVNEATGEMTIEELDGGLLATDIPKRRIIDFWPEADLTRAPGSDPRVIKPFGNMRQVQLTCLTADRHYFGSIVRPNTGTMTIPTVYRSKSVANLADYQLIDHPVYNIKLVYFFRPQPEDVDIFVDITTTEFANQAAAAQWIFTDTQDGLATTVDSGSFTASIAALQATDPGFPYRVHHGIGPEPTRAEDILNKLAVRGTVYGRTAAGAYTWVVDRAALHTTAQGPNEPFALGQGDGRAENILRVTASRQRKIEDRIRDLSLLGGYSFGFGSEAYLLRAQSVSPTAKGKTETLTNEFIGDIGTLRQECGYLMLRLLAERYNVEVEADMTARVVQLNQIVPVTVPHLRLGPTNPPYPLTVSSIQGTRDGWTIGLMGYDAGRFAYWAEVFVTAPNASQLTDYRYTYPAVPTSFTLLGGAAVILGDQAKSVTLQNVQATLPAVNASHFVVQLIVQGQAAPSAEFEQAGTAGSTVILQLRLDSGLTYTLQYFARNKANDPAFQDGIVGTYGPYTAAGDPAVPLQVNGVAVVQGTGKSLMVSWSQLAATNIGSYEVYRAVNTNVIANNAIVVDNTQGLTFTDVNVAYGNTYYYWVRGITRSGVAGPVGGPAAAAPSQIVSVDVGSGQINDGHITTLNSTKIFGTLTVDPGSTGIVAVLVTNSGEIRLRGFNVSPSRISFEDGSGATRGQIVANSAGVSFSTNSDASPYSFSLGSLSPGQGRWQFVDILAQLDVTLQAGRNVILSAPVGRIQASAQLNINGGLGGSSYQLFPSPIPNASMPAVRGFIYWRDPNSGAPLYQIPLY